MPTVHSRTALFALVQLLGLTLPLCAQTAANEKESEKAAPRSQQAVQRVEPDILYIRDKNGDLLPLINISLEDIRAYVESRDASATAPRATARLERLEVRGEVVGDYAVLSMELTIAASDPGWVRVPLRLGNFVLTEPPKFAAAGEHLMEFDPDGREFVAWFRGKAEKPHRVSLRGMAAVESDGTQFRLRLNAPRAVFSELELKVPQAEASGQVVSGGVLAETKPAAGKTQFRATGLANDFLLTWRAVAARRNESPTVLSVVGQIVSKIDGRGVDSEATLSINSFGREFSGFQVRLPRGATLLPGEQPDYSIVEVPAAGNATEDQRQRKMVEVRLKAKTSQPVSVKLVTKQGHDVSRQGTFDLGGFDVAGAVRQSGTLAVQVRDDWQVAFVARQGVVQTDELPAEMRADGVVAGFLYFGQPYSLSARVSPRQTRTSVDPRYVVEVGPHHLQLDATLKYHVAGAKVFSFSIDLGEWQLDPAGLEPATLVNSAALVFGAGNSVLVPLKQATTGDIELRIRARKPIEPGADSIAFGLLHPTADTVGSTELVVVPEDNVIVVPHTDEASGLTSAPANADVKLPAHRQAAWFYRSDVADPRFAAGFQVASRRLTSRVESRVTLAEGVAQVEQRLICTAAHEAAESLLLAVPQHLVSSAAVEVKLDGMPLMLEPSAAVDSEGDGPVGMRVLLPEQQLGDFELTVVYSWQDDALDELLSSATTVKAEIPLVMPAEGELLGNELTLVAEAGLHVEPVDKQWTLRSTQSGGDRQTLVFASAQPQPALVLGVSPTERDAAGSLSVERAWVQTWLTGSQRFDRAVFRFHTQDRRVRLTLPSGSSTESFHLDGEAVDAVPGTTPNERELLLSDGDGVERPHVLVATYDLADRSGGAGRLRFELPSFGEGRVRRFYWQLVLPAEDYLIQGPAGLSGEFVWLWKGLGWSRQPLRDSSELEIWSGAEQHELPLPPSVNTYLFSGIAMPGPVEISTVSRPVLVLASSGVLLAAGLLWIYFPWLRRPAWLFMAGVAVLAAAAVWPDLALLALQSAVVGMVLVMMAAALERALGRRPAPSVLRSGPSSIVSRGSTHTHARPASPVASTQTAALAVEVGAESKP
ncbi:MAG TPA: hypothetical protein VNH11_00010 [Pirellulales bacterium]|nr:hypothetical protein [Pirellulales bacterium]